MINVNEIRLRLLAAQFVQRTIERVTDDSFENEMDEYIRSRNNDNIN